MLSGTAVAYNYAFFTLLAYSPFPIEEAVTAAGSTFEAQELGLVVFGWGLALAIASALIAPMLTRRFGLGVLNTALTETVMEATDLPRNVASSTYSGVRFLGGAIAPAVSGPIAAALGAGAPSWFAVGALAIASIVLALGGRAAQHARPGFRRLSPVTAARVTARASHTSTPRSVESVMTHVSPALRR